MSKRVLVTGATSGIGRATALELAYRGCEIVVTGRREAELKAVAEACGNDTAFVVGDVSLKDDCLRIAALAASKLGDHELVVVHAAGIAEFGDFAEMASESIEAQIAVNLLGPMNLTHELLPTMLKAGQGHIVCVLSVAANHVFPGAAAYGASKAGLRMAAKVWAEEYRRKGIRVSSILPGAVDTPIWQGGGPPREQMLTAEAVANVIADLVMSPTDRSFDEILLMPPRGIL